jgi:hypothetical protein
MNSDLAKQQANLDGMEEEIRGWVRMLREVKTWKASYGEWAAKLETDVFDSFKSYKRENDENVRNMFAAVEEIGLLQRKMLEKMDPFSSQKRSRVVSFNERLPMQTKKMLGQENITMYGSRKCQK